MWKEKHYFSVPALQSSGQNGPFQSKNQILMRLRGLADSAPLKTEGQSLLAPLTPIRLRENDSIPQCEMRQACIQ